MKLGIRKRVGVSELVATLMMIGVTLTAGAAVLGWVNGQAKVSEGAYGTSVANNVNFLNERFVVLTESFSGTGSGGTCAGGTPPNYECTGTSFWIYNTGQVAFTLYSIRITSTSNNPNPLNILFYTANTNGCSASSQTCGFVAYTSTGTVMCSDAAPFSATTYQPGFYQIYGAGAGTAQPPQILPVSQLSSYPYQISMPTGATCPSGALYLYDGYSYTFTFTGLYGNTFSTSATVNG